MVEASGAGAPGGQGVRRGGVGEPDAAGGGRHELGDPALPADPAAVEHDDLLAQRGDVLGLVGGQQHRCPVPGRGEHPTQRGPLLGVEAAGGFVEHEEVGVADQCLGEAGPVPLPAGEPAQLRGGEVGETHQLEHPAYLLVAGVAVGPLLEGGHVVDERERREPAGEAVLLGQVAQPAADGGPAVRIGRVEPQEPDLPGAGGEHGRQDPEQRRLAGSVGTQQPGHPGPEDEVDVLQGGCAAEPSRHAGECDRGHALPPRWLRWLPRRRTTASETTARTAYTGIPASSTARDGAAKPGPATTATTAAQRTLTPIAARPTVVHVDAAIVVATAARLGASHASASASRPGSSSPATTVRGTVVASTASGAQQHQPEVGVRRRGRHLERRVRVRAVGHGHPGHGEQRRDDEEEEQTPVVADRGGQGREGQRHDGRGQPGGPERRGRPEQQRLVGGHAETGQQPLDRGQPRGLELLLQA